MICIYFSSDPFILQNCVEISLCCVAYTPMTYGKDILINMQNLVLELILLSKRLRIGKITQLLEINLVEPFLFFGGEECTHA